MLSSGPGTCEVEVTAPRFTAADATWQLPHADTPELHPYLQASAYLEVNAPEIQSLARQAVGDEKNPVLAAHRIEHFVRAYITKKDLNVGFGSAEETAKSREGDCTEHAVLCAALGRAVGLPTRCVVGFGYIPPGDDEPTITNAVDTDTGIFGFHMWAEAWIGPDQWVPMDAALNGFDVGHIAITKSALEEVNPIVDLNMPDPATDGKSQDRDRENRAEKRNAPARSAGAADTGTVDSSTGRLISGSHGAHKRARRSNGCLFF